MVGSLPGTTAGDSVPVVLILEPKEAAEAIEPGEVAKIEPGEVAKSSKSELTVPWGSSWARALYAPLLTLVLLLLELAQPKLRFVDPKRLFNIPNPKSRFLLPSSCLSVCPTSLSLSVSRRAACSLASCSLARCSLVNFSLVDFSLARFSAWQEHSRRGTRHPIMPRPLCPLRGKALILKQATHCAHLRQYL